MTELERYDTSRALFLVLGECCRIIVDLGEADAAATDQQPGPASVAHQPKRRHKTKTKSWLPFLLVFVATSFVTALAYWKFGLVLEAIEESAQVIMSRPFGGAVMIDETTLVLLAFGAIGVARHLPSGPTHQAGGKGQQNFEGWKQNTEGRRSLGT